MVENHKKESWLQGIINQLQIHGIEAGSIIGVCAIIEVIICIVLGILNKVAKDNTDIGLILFGILITIVAIFTLITSLILFSYHFNMGIKMSRTRNEMMIRMSAIVSIFHVALLGLTMFISRIAVWIYSTYNPGPWGIGKIPGSIWLSIILGPVILGMFAGSVVTRFGKKGGTILYFVFIFACFAPSIVLNQMDEHTVLDIYLGVEVIAGILIVLLGSAIAMLKTSSIR